MWLAILGFCAFLSLGWWIVTLGFVVWAFILTDKDCWGWAITSMIVYFLFLNFMAGLNILEFAAYHPMKFLIGIVIYFIIGFIWSFPRWWLFVKDVAEQHLKEKKEYFRRHKPNKKSTEEIQIKAEKEIERNWKESISHRINKPMALDNKNQITMWIIYWPFSLIWTFINDGVKRFIRHIVTKFQKLYQKISDRAFKNIDTEIEEE